MTIMTFVRHGATEWNIDGRFMSRTDLPLSSEGISSLDHARTLISHSKPARVVTSPALRCLQTTEKILESTGLNDFEVWEDLVEIGFGDFEGQTVNELTFGSFSAEFSKWLDPSEPSMGAPGGETWEQVNTRCLRVLKRLENLQTDTLVVGHGYFNRAVLVRALFGLLPRHLRTLESSNGSLSAISNHRGYWRLEYHNSLSPHLSQWGELQGDSLDS